MARLRHNRMAISCACQPNRRNTGCIARKHPEPALPAPHSKAGQPRNYSWKRLPSTGPAIRQANNGAYAFVLSGGSYVRRLQAFRTFGGLEFDGLTLGQRLETFIRNSRVMYEYIFTAVFRSEKSETFAIVKPLHCTKIHNNDLLIITH